MPCGRPDSTSRILGSAELQWDKPVFLITEHPSGSSGDTQDQSEDPEVDLAGLSDVTFEEKTWSEVYERIRRGWLDTCGKPKK